jgi:hypothetical protein
VRDPKDLAEVEGWLRDSIRAASWQAENGSEQGRDYHLGRRTALVDVAAASAHSRLARSRS